MQGRGRGEGLHEEYGHFGDGHVGFFGVLVVLCVMLANVSLLVQLKIGTGIRLEQAETVQTYQPHIQAGDECHNIISAPPPVTNLAQQTLTFNPIHLILPTSSFVNGLRSLPMVSFLPVGSPALSTDLPLKTFTSTSLPSCVATPTSIDESTGSPMRTEDDEDFGWKRTRPTWD